MSTSDGPDDSSVTWDGYTDYREVAGRVASEIHDATAAAAFIERYHVEGGQFDAREIAEAAGRLKSAAMLLDEQLAYFGEYDDEFQEILDEWRGDDGRIAKLQRTDLLRTHPDWLTEFIRDLHRAGLLLGYLKAGREEEVKDDGDAADSEVMDVIEEMTL